MDERKVDYWVHENALARMERIIRRLTIVIAVAIICVILSNVLWIMAWTQYDYTSEESHVVVDAGDGIANFIGNNGDISNGTDSSYTQGSTEN